MLDKDEVKEAIVNVARHIFSRFGFRKTTMDEIAIASRKGKSSIYYYFASKEEIFQAVVEKEASILKQELKKAINEADSPAQKLKAHVLVRITRDSGIGSPNGLAAAPRITFASAPAHRWPSRPVVTDDILERQLYFK